jgi:hypothetical protein
MIIIIEDVSSQILKPLLVILHMVFQVPAFLGVLPIIIRALMNLGLSIAFETIFATCFPDEEFSIVVFFASLPSSIDADLLSARSIVDEFI